MGNVLLSYGDYIYNEDGYVVVSEGLEKLEYVAAIAQYCRLAEIKNNECYVQDIGLLRNVTLNFLNYLGIKSSCEVVPAGRVRADICYEIFTGIVRAHGMFPNIDIFFNTDANLFILNEIDKAQPEDVRLGVNFIEMNMHLMPLNYDDGCEDVFYADEFYAIESDADNFYTDELYDEI